MKKVKKIKLLLNSIPAPILVIFVVSIIMMNLLANKSINFKVDWVCCDCGILVGWISFFCLDVIAKRFGPIESSIVSIFALAVSLVCSVLFYIASKIDGLWAVSDENIIICNEAVNNVFKGNWFIIFGSATAFLASSFTNSFLNWVCAKIYKKDNFLSFVFRSYISTLIGQFVDNMTFALIISMNLFGWSFVQCVICSFMGMIIELLSEVIFLPIGYKVVKKWEKNKIGNEYLKYKGEL